MTDQPMSIVSAARRLGSTRLHIQRLYERGFLPHPPRVGNARLVYLSELPKIEAALREAGYPVGRLAEAVA